MKLLIDNVDIQLEFDRETPAIEKDIMGKINREFNPLSQARFHSALFRKHIWDGRIKVCDIDHRRVPTGLYDDLMNLLHSYPANLILEPKDMRGDPLRPSENVPDDLVMESKDGYDLKTLKLRDYQLEAVNAVFDDQRGIVKYSTNAGKSAIAYVLFNYLLDEIDKDEHLLFIAPRTSIMEQLYNNFCGYLGEDKIGIWGNGKKDLDHPIVCASIQTLASAIKDPKIKLTSANDKLTERFATTYYDKIMGSDNALSTLKMFAHSFTPKYKYEQEDKRTLMSLAQQVPNDRETLKVFKAYKRKYEKLMRKKNKKGFEKYEEGTMFLDSVRAVICDECHSCASASYQEVFKNMPNARVRMGMTGSLETKNAERFTQIKAILGGILVSVDNKDMIELGYSAKPHIKLLSINTPTDLDTKVEQYLRDNPVPRYMLDLSRYNETYRQGVIENDSRNETIAELADGLAKRKDKMATLIFVNSIHQGENIEKFVKAKGTPYAFIQGMNSEEEREEVRKGVVSGNIPIVISTKIWDTGIDIPNLKYLVMVDASKSYVATLQRIGRVLRIMPEKQNVYIFDLVDRTSESLFKHAKARISYYKEQGFLD